LSPRRISSRRSLARNASLILGSGSGDRTRDEPEWGDCIELADEAYGAEVRPPRELEAGEPQLWSSTYNNCVNLRLFEQIATAAGPDLTNESFATAADSFGSYELPGAPFASIEAGKYDGLDTMLLTTWDQDETRWAPISEPFDVTS